MPYCFLRYGDTSKYGIFLNIACEIRLLDTVYSPSLNIRSRYNQKAIFPEVLRANMQVKEVP